MRWIEDIVARCLRHQADIDEIGHHARHKQVLAMLNATDQAAEAERKAMSEMIEKNHALWTDQYHTILSRINVIEEKVTGLVLDLREMNAAAKRLQLELSEKRRSSKINVPDFDIAEAAALARMDAIE